MTDGLLFPGTSSSFSQSSRIVETLLIIPMLLILSRIGEVWFRSPFDELKQELGCKENWLEKVAGLRVQGLTEGWSESREREQYSRDGVVGFVTRAEVILFVIVCFTDTVRYVWKLLFRLGLSSG
jgi:hypothetical protein